MSPKNKPPLKPLAWNGIAVKIPVNWEIDSLDESHMMIGEQSMPRAEIKWTDAPKKFILVKYLKQFISQSQKQLGIKIHEQSTPGSFFHPENHFEFFFFSWESDAAEGTGTLIFCNECRRLTMIRFFSKNTGLSNALKDTILASFSDHPKGDQINWQIFGMDFPTPAYFNLLDYSFKPGIYSVSFKHKKTKLEVFSWGPAQFLLSKATLSEFAIQRLPQIKGFGQTGFCRRGSFLEWTFKTYRLKNIENVPILNKFFLFSIFRICHDEESNRIFGIIVDSSKRFEHDIIRRSMIGDI